MAVNEMNEFLPSSHFLKGNSRSIQVERARLKKVIWDSQILADFSNRSTWNFVDI